MIDWVTGKFWITHNPDVLRSGQSIRTKIVDGVELIEYDIAYAKKHACKRITLLTDNDNFAAHHFYKHFGFRNSSMQPMRLILNNASCES